MCDMWCVGVLVCDVWCAMCGGWYHTHVLVCDMWYHTHHTSHTNTPTYHISHMSNRHDLNREVMNEQVYWGLPPASHRHHLRRCFWVWVRRREVRLILMISLTKWRRRFERWCRSSCFPLSVYPCFSLSLCSFRCLFISLSLCVSLCLCVCVCLSISHARARVWRALSLCLFLFLFLSVSLSFRLSVGYDDLSDKMEEKIREVTSLRMTWLIHVWHDSDKIWEEIREFLSPPIHPTPFPPSISSSVSLSLSLYLSSLSLAPSLYLFISVSLPRARARARFLSLVLHAHAFSLEFLEREDLSCPLSPHSALVTCAHATPSHVTFTHTCDTHTCDTSPCDTSHVTFHDVFTLFAYCICDTLPQCTCHMHTCDSPTCDIRTCSTHSHIWHLPIWHLTMCLLSSHSAHVTFTHVTLAHVTLRHVIYRMWHPTMCSLSSHIAPVTLSILHMWHPHTWNLHVSHLHTWHSPMWHFPTWHVTIFLLSLHIAHVTLAHVTFAHMTLSRVHSHIRTFPCAKHKCKYDTLAELFRGARRRAPACTHTRILLQTQMNYARNNTCHFSRMLWVCVCVEWMATCRTHTHTHTHTHTRTRTHTHIHTHTHTHTTHKHTHTQVIKGRYETMTTGNHVLQCVAVCCSVLQCIHRRYETRTTGNHSRKSTHPQIYHTRQLWCWLFKKITMWAFINVHKNNNGFLI